MKQGDKVYVELWKIGSQTKKIPGVYMTHANDFSMIILVQDKVKGFVEDKFFHTKVTERMVSGLDVDEEFKRRVSAFSNPDKFVAVLVKSQRGEKWVLVERNLTLPQATYLKLCIIEDIGIPNDDVQIVNQLETMSRQGVLNFISENLTRTKE